jgi:formylglycine-generating enzyme required for sulfatase activity
MGTAPDATYASGIESPRHEVALSRGFWMGITPVTGAQWSPVMGVARPAPRDERLPARGMSWRRAREFCQALTAALRQAGALDAGWEVTLPTEAQWEYACRAGTDTPWHFGSDPSLLDEYAWYRANSDETLQPVGKKRPNPWGLHDLYGNVSEWCLDAAYTYSAAAETDPVRLDPDHHFHISRGGTCTDDVAECRSASRVFMNSDNPYGEDSGLRIACVPVITPEHLHR